MKTMIMIAVIIMLMIAAAKMLNLNIECQMFVRFTTENERRVSYDSSTAI